MTPVDDGVRLPPAARARMAEIKASGTWGSALSVSEFAAIKSVGFEPVGQVLGAAVYKIGFEGDHVCPTYRVQTEATAVNLRRAAYTAVSGRVRGRRVNSFTPLLNAHYAARRAAISRMATECAELGGHGVVGVTLTVSPFPGGSLEFRAIGTAVRAPGVKPIRRHFISELSGQEFATLLTAGFMPVGIALGISIGVRHDDIKTVDQVAGWWNTEVKGYTELVNRTRCDATAQLRKDVIKQHADGVVTRAMELRIDEYECRGMERATDHVAEATIVGTAIARFVRNQWSAPTAALAVMSLGERPAQQIEMIDPMMRSSE
jgi:uncharacterized protein YbjQ (UPF0145 family)